MDLLAAICLLTGLPGTPEAVPTEEEFPAIRDAVHKLAVEWQILDERERGWVLAHRSKFGDDLDMLRRRYREFLDAPRLEESQRFPDHAIVQQLVSFNRAYRRHLGERFELELDRGDVLGAAMAEADALHRVWDAVYDARCETYYVIARRRGLVRLRDMLGEEDYRAVNLPPNVPVWRWRD